MRPFSICLSILRSQVTLVPRLADGLGHHRPRRHIQGAEAIAGGVTAASRKIGNTHWRGHDDVMQIRSFRGSGEPVWVSALPSAGVRLGPDPRRALGPAATPAASTGRTRDRTRPMLQLRQKVLARAPSTRDPKRNILKRAVAISIATANAHRQPLRSCSHRRSGAR